MLGLLPLIGQRLALGAARVLTPIFLCPIRTLLRRLPLVVHSTTAENAPAATPAPGPAPVPAPAEEVFAVAPPLSSLSSHSSVAASASPSTASLDRRCDAWYKCLLGDVDSSSLSYRRPVYDQLTGEQKLYDMPEGYGQERYPSTLAFGCDSFNIPIVRKKAEAFRQFDVEGLVKFDFKSAEAKDGKTSCWHWHFCGDFSAVAVRRNGTNPHTHTLLNKHFTPPPIPQPPPPQSHLSTSLPLGPFCSSSSSRKAATFYPAPPYTPASYT